MQFATDGGRDRPPMDICSHLNRFPGCIVTATKGVAVCTIGARFVSALSSGNRLVAFVQQCIERGFRAGLGLAGFDPARKSATGLPASPEAFGNLP